MTTVAAAMKLRITTAGSMALRGYGRSVYAKLHLYYCVHTCAVFDAFFVSDAMRPQLPPNRRGASSMTNVPPTPTPCMATCVTRLAVDFHGPTLWRTTFSVTTPTKHASAAKLRCLPSRDPRSMRKNSSAHATIQHPTAAASATSTAPTFSLVRFRECTSIDVAATAMSTPASALSPIRYATAAQGTNHAKADICNGVIVKQAGRLWSP